MRRSLVAVYVHLVWATWDRLPLLEPPIERAVHRAIQAKVRELRGEPLAVGGIEDHVHLLVEVPATLAIASLVHGVKGASAHLVNHELVSNGSFKWQGAYAAFSVSSRHLDQARNYIAQQREHHAANDPAVRWEHRIFAMMHAANTTPPTSA